MNGLAKHATFGLRQQWLELYLRKPCSWVAEGLLGTRQVLSLQSWLKTIGIITIGNKETILADLFRKNGPHSLLAWELVWINTAFSFATARWFVTTVGTSPVTSAELKEMLCADYPMVSRRTVANGILELVGLLANTPIGNDLKQGQVLGKKNRTIIRSGLEFPSAVATLYALHRLFVINKQDSLCLHDEMLWPWIIFGCSKDYVLGQLIFRAQEWLVVTVDKISWKFMSEEESHVLGLFRLP